MQIKSNLITAIVTALSVVALTWNPAADAAAPESSSISVCVNKKSGAMRNASKCSKSERRIEMAQANVKLTVPPPALVNQIPAQIQPKSTQVATEVPIAELAGQSVQTVVSHITVPNSYGIDADEVEVGARYIDFPTCPGVAPVRISFGLHSTNYLVDPQQATLSNNDESGAGAIDKNVGRVYFYNPPGIGSYYPKDGDIDLYLVTVCAPILVVQ